jgi:zinc and cadmium transporter
MWFVASSFVPLASRPVVMSLPLLILVYCALTVVASLFGGWLPSLVKLTHVRMQSIMSLVSGLMLGIAMLHMLPQAAEELPSMTSVASAMLAGVLVMFFLLRLFHVHGHGELVPAACHHAAEEPHEHAHHTHVEASATGHPLNWVGLYFGLAIHTLLDGVALAASAVADAQHQPHGVTLFGFGTFLAVVLHKPLDALAITSLMHAGGWTQRSQTAVNFGYALMCPLGALLFCLSTSQLAAYTGSVVGYALAFSAGFFLCIALGDLLPEVQFHTHDRWKLSVALLAGVAIAYGIELTHSHPHGDFHHADDGHLPVIDGR